MEKKLILAMSLMNDPEILFPDEPTSGLDVISARLIKDMVSELNKEGKSIFLTTHYMEEANQLCSRIAVINHGKIAAIDAPEKLKMKVGGLEWVEISYNMPLDISDFHTMPDVIDVRMSGDKMQLYTNEPGRIVYQLVDYSRSNDLEIVTLNTLTPTLEDVFIKLTGEVK